MTSKTGIHGKDQLKQLLSCDIVGRYSRLDELSLWRIHALIMRRDERGDTHLLVIPVNLAHVLVVDGERLQDLLDGCLQLRMS